MTLNILIVDDEPLARTRLVSLLADIQADWPNVVVGSVGTAQAALDCMAAASVDLVLLDIRMPGTDGIALARRLAQFQPAPTVIFVTAFEAHAVNAFEVKALDYLLKPVRAARLAAALGRAAEARMRATPVDVNPAGEPVAGAPDAYFSVHERGRLLRVPAADVLYLKAELKYVTLRTARREYLLEGSLQAIEAMFTSLFVRVHRNTLVARRAIAGVERVAHGSSPLPVPSSLTEGGERAADGWQVILHGVDDRLPVSRRQLAVVKSLVR